MKACVSAAFLTWTVGCRDLPEASGFGWPEDASAPADTVAVVDVVADAGKIADSGPQLCGNSVCDEGENVATCSGDCAGLFAHLAGPCPSPGYPDGCAVGYVCVGRTPGAGGAVCVANFPTWLPLDVTRNVADFVVESETVTDEWTGLMWAKKAIPDLDVATAMAACPSQNWGGFSDWRLPTRAELRSLVDYSTSAPAWSAPQLQWNPDRTEFLTAVIVPDPDPRVVIVDFKVGLGQSNDLETLMMARCVRGGRVGTPTMPRYLPNPDGITVFDRVLGRTWQRGPMVPTRNWAQANVWCSTNAAKLPGVGWRLPTIRELESLLMDRPGWDLPEELTLIAGQEWTSTDGVWMVIYDHVGPFVVASNTGELQGVRCIR